MKKTLVLGASPKKNRYSYLAVKRLAEHGHEVVAVAKRASMVDGIPILTAIPENETFHTVTVYLNEHNQEEYYDLILRMKPERVIFNPGAENPGFGLRLKKNGIAPVNACTLVMLSIGTY